MNKCVCGHLEIDHDENVDCTFVESTDLVCLCTKYTPRFEKPLEEEKKVLFIPVLASSVAQQLEDFYVTFRDYTEKEYIMEYHIRMKSLIEQVKQLEKKLEEKQK